MKTTLSTCQAVVVGCTLSITPIVCAQSASSFNPLANNIATPRPFDAGTTSSNALAMQAQNPYLGSVPTSVLVPGVLPLTLSEVVSRALKANLGLIDSEQDHAQSRAARIRAISALLPQLSAELVENYRNFPINTIGGQKLGLPNIISAYNYQVATIGYRQNLLDISALHEVKATRAEEEVSEANLADSRNIVVLASASAYLQVLASQSRVKTAQADLASSQALETLLKDRVKREVNPEIDAIRSTVARASAEQRLALAEVRLEKDKLGLTRIIGLPIEQEFTLTTDVGFKQAPQQDVDTLVEEASLSRQDLESSGSACGVL